MATSTTTAETSSVTTTATDRWYEQESNYTRSTRVSSITVPVVGAVVVLCFCIAVFVFAVHMRKRRRILERARSRTSVGTDAGNALYMSHASRMYAESDFDRVIKDLPPPYPGLEDAPPSYEDACIILSNESAISEREIPNRSRNEQGASENYSYVPEGNELENASVHIEQRERESESEGRNLDIQNRPSNEIHVDVLHSVDNNRNDYGLENV